LASLRRQQRQHACLESWLSLVNLLENVNVNENEIWIWTANDRVSEIGLEIERRFSSIALWIVSSSLRSHHRCQKTIGLDPLLLDPPLLLLHDGT